MVTVEVKTSEEVSSHSSAVTVISDVEGPELCSLIAIYYLPLGIFRSSARDERRHLYPGTSTYSNFNDGVLTAHKAMTLVVIHDRGTVSLGG